MNIFIHRQIIVFSVILYLGLVEKQVVFIELTSVNRTSFTKLINVH